MSNHYSRAMEEIRKIADGFCHEVMNDGASKPDKCRGLLVCSASGTGMTHLLNSVLKENDMYCRKDYYDISNGDVSAEGLYETFYKNNGKLIIEIDAYSDIFSGRRRMKFWQQFLNDDYLVWPGESSELSKPEEDVPANFHFSGYVIIFSNMTYKELERKVIEEGNTPEEWHDVWKKFNGIEVFPSQAELWEAIQLELRSQQHMPPGQLKDEDCIVPRKEIDGFILDINDRLSNVKDPTMVPFTWWDAANMGRMLKGDKGRRIFELKLEQIYGNSKQL